MEKLDDPSNNNLGYTPQFEVSSRMTLKQIGSLVHKLVTFLFLFRHCFKRIDAARLLANYVNGQLSDIQRKNCEAIALRFKTPPRTRQRFLE